MKQNMQNQTIAELYADEKKSEHSSNPNDTLKLAKSLYEKFHSKDARPKLPLLNFWVNKIYNKKKNRK